LWLLIGLSLIKESLCQIKVGDLFMMSSRGEIRIHEILEEAGLNFKEEYIFPDLKSSNGKPLRFDFVVFDDDGYIDFIIEF
jgi:hypothetical protein